MQTEVNFIVRYAETDQMGIVHHSNYAVWYEIGRSDFLKRMGISNRSIEDRGVLLPLYELSCKYIAPAKFEDEIKVVTEIKTFSRVRVIFNYLVYNAQTNQLLAKGETKHAWTDKSLKPVNAEKIIPDIYSKIVEITNNNKGEKL